MKEKVFISSVQKEFGQERLLLANFLREDALLSTFFEPFLFEEVAATTHSPGDVYIKEVTQSAIYIGLFGVYYGYEDQEGISPTEREYDKAKEKGIPRWIYILGDSTLPRHSKEKNFINKVGNDVARKRFLDWESLKKEVYSSCILYLKQTGRIESHEFDNSINTKASLDDINAAKVKQFVKDARLKRNFPLKETADKAQVLQHLNMLRNGGVMNSALLAFSNNLQSFFPTATIKCAHFHGFTVQKPIPDLKEFKGTVFEMAHDAVDFILSKISLSTGTRSHSNQVATVYEVPREAIAEAIINAVAHRDYMSKGSIQVSVFKDRIEIQNPGSLPAELELDDLKVPHGSYPHNPLLASCMFLTGDIERFGTGILEIFELSKAEGLATPIFSLDEGFKVILWRPSATIHDTIHETIHDDLSKTKTYKEIEDLTHRLIYFISNPMSRTEIMEMMGLKNRSHFAKNYLEPALSTSIIEMTLPNNPTSRKQKYRLTTKGEAIRKQLLDDQQ